MKFVNYTLLVTNRLFFIMHFYLSLDLISDKRRLNYYVDLQAESFSCLRTNSTKSWSLKGRTIWTVSFSFWGRYWLRVFNFRRNKRPDCRADKVLHIFQQGEHCPQRLTFFRKIRPRRWEAICTVKHGFQKSSFISHVDIALVVEQKTRVSRFSVHFGLNLRSSVK